MQKTFYCWGFGYKIGDFVSVTSAVVLPAFLTLMFIL